MSPHWPAGPEQWLGFVDTVLFTLAYLGAAILMWTRSKKRTRLGKALITADGFLGIVFLYGAFTRLYPHERNTWVHIGILTAGMLASGWFVIELIRTTDWYNDAVYVLTHSSRKKRDEARHGIRDVARDEVRDPIRDTAHDAERAKY